MLVHAATVLQYRCLPIAHWKSFIKKTAFINSGSDQANPHLIMGVLKVEALEVQV